MTTLRFSALAAAICISSGLCVPRASAKSTDGYHCVQVFPIVVESGSFAQRFTFHNPDIAKGLPISARFFPGSDGVVPAGAPVDYPAFSVAIDTGRDFTRLRALCPGILFRRGLPGRQDRPQPKVPMADTRSRSKARARACAQTRNMHAACTARVAAATPLRTWCATTRPSRASDAQLKTGKAPLRQGFFLRDSILQPAPASFVTPSSCRCAHGQKNIRIRRELIQGRMP